MHDPSSGKWTKFSERSSAIKGNLSSLFFVTKKFLQPARRWQGVGRYRIAFAVKLYTLSRGLGRHKSSRSSDRPVTDKRRIRFRMPEKLKTTSRLWISSLEARVCRKSKWWRNEGVPKAFRRERAHVYGKCFATRLDASVRVRLNGINVMRSAFSNSRGAFAFG